MHAYRSLPALLRAVSILGVLLFLTTVILFALTYFATALSSSPPRYRDLSRVWSSIGVNLFCLGQAYVYIAIAYRRCAGRPGLGPLPLDSWQSQVRAILLLSALPLCGIALVLVIPPTSAAFAVVELPILILAALQPFVVVTAFVIGMAGTGPMRTPPTR